MKILAIQSGYITQRVHVMNDAIADAAYATLKAAMAEYQEFGNDKARTVSIALDEGEMTFRLASLADICIEDCVKTEDAIVEREVWSARVKAKIAARMSPAPETAD